MFQKICDEKMKTSSLELPFTFQSYPIQGPGYDVSSEGPHSGASI